jgi:hypothetical protein
LEVLVERGEDVPSPSAVVRACHTFVGGDATSMLRSIRSGNPMTHLQVATIWLPSRPWQPDGRVKGGRQFGQPERRSKAGLPQIESERLRRSKVDWRANRNRNG